MGPCFQKPAPSVAIYDYDARTDEDLTFRVGDLLKIIDDRLVVFSRFF